MAGNLFLSFHNQAPMPIEAVKRETAQKISAIVAGCGSAGVNILASSRSGRRITVDSSPSADLRLDRVLLSASETDASVMKRTDHPFLEKFRRLSEGADVVMIVAGLGGFAGGAASAAVARAARALSLPVISSVALPFDVEGASRRAAARKSLELLADSSSITVPFENSIINQTMPNVRMTRALDIMNRIVVSPLEEVMQYADTSFLEGIARRKFRGTYAVTHASGLEWERKGAQSIVAEFGADAAALSRMHLFLSMSRGMENSAERLGEEVAGKLEGCDVTVWVRDAEEEGHNRIGALGLR